VMQVVKEATFVLAKKGIRTEVVLKADVRPGYTNMMNTKVEKINKLLGEQKD
ncbi:thiamine-binding protein, partial [Acinetobacter baumannii]|nr:thiamine-binding protein [Acinetobacter baumannii]